MLRSLYRRLVSNFPEECSRLDFFATFCIKTKSKKKEYISIFVIKKRSIFIITIPMPTITSINPYTGETNATFETLTDAQLTETIDQANHAYLTRKNVPKAEKKALFLRLADLLDARNDASALLETREMGSLWSFSKNVIKGTANLIRWNANNFETILGDEPIDAE